MAELTGLPSPSMDWNASDLPQALKKFKATAELYFTGPLSSKSEEEKVSYLLIWSGDEGIELVSTWSLTNDDKKKLSTYWKKFEEYVAPKSNFRLARYKLRTLKQQEDESVDSFIKKVRILVSECKYDSVDEHIIDALIFGSCRPRVQAKLLEYDASLALNKAIDIARTEEATSSQLQDIRGSANLTPVHAIKHNPQPAQRKLQPHDKNSHVETVEHATIHLRELFAPRTAQSVMSVVDKTTGAKYADLKATRTKPPKEEQIDTEEIDRRNKYILWIMMQMTKQKMQMCHNCISIHCLWTVCPNKTHKPLLPYTSILRTEHCH
ncbi:uncharacterized protein LOC114574966 [Exaiptasia diaphana]|uniref:Retrotransposon gag domain-containing protein n=1 Tax=Exaiptasia diaphana TaxID=2652724 RepID=A0A913YHW6_EXADI|nr:uncharacterized protein LOC114574966 [Exaiptasia diaphana]